MNVAEMFEQVYNQDYNELDLEFDEFLAAQVKYKNAVISGESALTLHWLIDARNDKLQLTFKHGKHAIDDPKIDFFYKKPEKFEGDLQLIDTPFGNEVVALTPQRAILDIWENTKSDIRWKKQSVKNFIDGPQKMSDLIDFINLRHGSQKLLDYLYAMKEFNYVG
ncbi:MAG: hypothetical protein LBM27_05170 [Lactobacillaceae bacterium]|jgi:hypothetical protein|nr:hypothetical protein [Lactobacillaceae bacterium]